MRELKKALKTAGITNATPRGGYGDPVGVELPDDTACDLFWQKVAKWGGYKTGWGTWRLTEGYEDKGDPNDITSRHHY